MRALGISSAFFLAPARANDELPASNGGNARSILEGQVGMKRSRPGHGRFFAFVVAIAVIGSQDAGAAGIGWESRGAFETCLESRLNDWVRAKAELVVNEDPAAGEVDDMDVALWAATALEGCESQAGHGNQTSENQFSRHMAHWREHIHSIAQTVRQRVRAD